MIKYAICTMILRRNTMMTLSSPGSKRKSLTVAFCIPFAMLLLVMLIAQCEPFSNLRSMLYSDMYHQYYPFFVEFRNALRSGKGVLYTWSVGLGMDYLSLISYYLASPLNLLAVLIPESWTLEYFSLLMPIKLGLASVFFAIFLNRMFHREDLSISLFGSFYGLCAWALGYQWNVMWLDTFALLPLVALGTVYLIRNQKGILYTLSLFLAVFANYYIGFFVCIFVFLLFFGYEICRWRGLKRFCRDFVRIGFYTVLALGMTCVLELPALAGLQNTQSSVNSFPTTFRLNIADENTLLGLVKAMGQVAGNMMGGGEVTFKEGLPNVYCGVGSVILAVLFLTQGGVRLRDKILSVLVLLFFNVSFIIRQLDYLWHGMHFTNMIPYRFSFLYSFVVLYMAYRGYLARDSFRRWQIILAGVCGVGLMLVSDSLDDPAYLAFNAGFLLLYLFSLLYDRPGTPQSSEATEAEVNQWRQNLPRKQQRSAWMLAGLMVLELGLNVLNFGLRFSYTNVGNYPKGTVDTETVLADMVQREQDTLFYRAETTHSQTLNDGALNGYYGISTFTSSANVRVTEFMKALGYGAKNTYNRYCFEESSPVSNLFLGIKYMIERDGNVEENDYFDIVSSSGNVYLLENNAYLPLGFLVEPELENLSLAISDRFAMQNILFTQATGLDQDVWSMVREVTITSELVTIDNASIYQCNYSDAQTGGKIIYEFTAEENGFMCLDFDVTDRNNYTVYLNGEQLYTESLNLPQMIAASNVAAGDVVRVELKCKSGEDGRTTVKAAILDGALFRTGYEKLNASTLELTAFETTYLAGTIHCNRDGLLYTSIPQDGNWKVYVDGVQVEHTLVGDCMIGVMLLEGSHQVEFRYENLAFSYGWKISLACAMVFAITVILTKTQKRGKYQR